MSREPSSGSSRASSGSPKSNKTRASTDDGDTGHKVPPNFGLHAAAASGNTTLVSYALENGQPVNCVLSGVTPLHAAATTGNAAVINLLISSGADVNALRLRDQHPTPSRQAPGAEGSTPLHFAAANGHAIVARILLENGALPSAADKDGNTPEALAVAIGHHECAQLIRAWIEAYGPTGLAGLMPGTSAASEEAARPGSITPTSSAPQSPVRASHAVRNQKSLDQLCSAAAGVKATLLNKRSGSNLAKTPSNSALRAANNNPAVPAKAVPAESSVAALSLSNRLNRLRAGSLPEADANDQCRRGSIESNDPMAMGFSTATTPKPGTDAKRRPSLPSIFEKAAHPANSLKTALASNSSRALPSKQEPADRIPSGSTTPVSRAAGRLTGKRSLSNLLRRATGGLAHSESNPNLAKSAGFDSGKQKHAQVQNYDASAVATAMIASAPASEGRFLPLQSGSAFKSPEPGEEPGQENFATSDGNFTSRRPARGKPLDLSIARSGAVSADGQLVGVAVYSPTLPSENARTLHVAGRAAPSAITAVSKTGRVDDGEASPSRLNSKGLQKGRRRTQSSASALQRRVALQDTSDTPPLSPIRRHAAVNADEVGLPALPPLPISFKESSQIDSSATRRALMTTSSSDHEHGGASLPAAEIQKIIKSRLQHRPSAGSLSAASQTSATGPVDRRLSRGSASDLSEDGARYMPSSRTATRLETKRSNSSIRSISLANASSPAPLSAAEHAQAIMRNAGTNLGPDGKPISLAAQLAAYGAALASEHPQLHRSGVGLRQSNSTPTTPASIPLSLAGSSPPPAGSIALNTAAPSTRGRSGSASSAFPPHVLNNLGGAAKGIRHESSCEALSAQNARQLPSVREDHLGLEGDESSLPSGADTTSPSASGSGASTSSSTVPSTAGRNSSEILREGDSANKPFAGRGVGVASSPSAPRHLHASRSFGVLSPSPRTHSQSSQLPKKAAVAGSSSSPLSSRTRASSEDNRLK